MSWLDNSNNANCFKNTYIEGFIDVSGGGIRTYNDEGKIMISGDASFNKNVYVKSGLHIEEHNGIDSGLSLNNTLVKSTAIELNRLSNATAANDSAGKAVILNDSNGLTIENMIISSNFLPETDNAVNIGNENFSFRDIHVHDANIYQRLIVNEDVSLNANLRVGNSLFVGGNNIGTQITALDTSTTNKFDIVDDSLNSLDISMNSLETRIATLESGDISGGTTTSREFALKGSQIDGVIMSSERFGESVAMSADGNVVLVSARFNNDAYNKAGAVRVYEWSGSDWTLKGNQINGLAEDEYLGLSVSINADGTIIAMSAPFTDVGYSNSGIVRIYEWSGSDWILKGSEINGLTQNEYLGHNGALSLNSDGTIIAIGANGNDDAFSEAGCTRIYEWSGSDWILKGSQINGLTQNENSGRSASLSSDGTTVAIGSYRNSDAFTNAGCVRIYEWNGVGARPDWILKGSQINGLEANEECGTTVSINSDGTIVAVGAPLNDNGFNSAGAIRIYEWSGSDWTLKGSEINGLEEYDSIGSVKGLTLNADGTVFSVSINYSDYAYTNAGAVRIYEWSGSDWTLLNQIDGQVESEYFGYALSMSADGSYVAVGSVSGNGFVRIYSTGVSTLNTTSTTTTTTTLNTTTTTTSTGNLYVEGDISLNSRLYIQNTDILDLITSLQARITTLENN